MAKVLSVNISLTSMRVVTFEVVFKLMDDGRLMPFLHVTVTATMTVNSATLRTLLITNFVRSQYATPLA